LLLILQSEIAVLRLELILTIKGAFCSDIAQLFYGSALKFLTAFIFLVANISL